MIGLAPLFAKEADDRQLAWSQQLLARKDNHALEPPIVFLHMLNGLLAMQRVAGTATCVRQRVLEPSAHTFEQRAVGEAMLGLGEQAVGHTVEPTETNGGGR